MPRCRCASKTSAMAHPGEYARQEPVQVGIRLRRRTGDPAHLLGGPAPARRGDPLGQVLGVASDAGEPARAPRVLPRQAEEVQPGAVRHAPDVGWIPPPVEDRYVYPPVVAVETGDAPAPGDRLGTQVEV